MRSAEPAAAGRTRRRGPALERAIYRAALDELAATGYPGLTMEGIARRAGTGKAALYRRWDSKKDLILDAMLRVLPDPRETARSGSVRDGLLAALAIMTDALAGHGAYPGFDIMAQVLREPELRQAFAARVIEPRLQMIHALLRRAAARREIPEHAATPLVARTGPALVFQAFVLTGGPPSRTELARIVDAILMPLVTRPGRAPQPRPTPDGERAAPRSDEARIRTGVEAEYDTGR